jgi:hypothetical protein
MTTFAELTISGWRQFKNVHLTFHPRLTVLTGANGSGKTALLRLLARHFGWAYPELTVPTRDRAGGLIYLLSYLHALQELRTTAIPIGSITYAPEGTVAPINAQPSQGPIYNTDIYNIQQVQGVFIPANRPDFIYQTVETIPLRPLDSQQSYTRFLDARRSRAMSQYSQFSEVYHLKETLISWALFGYGNEVVTADENKLSLFVGFQQLLRTLLPDTLGFSSIEIRPPEVVLKTQSGEFMIDAVSGGIASIIDLAWMIYSARGGQKMSESVVLIDEVENHLHATMQRSVLPNLLDSFPNTQFIVSTHSPLVVSSVKDSNVFVLDYDADHEVISQRLDLVNRAGTASEILREVLGVSVTTPIWVEQSLDEIATRYSALDVNRESFQSLRDELAALGLGEFAPDTIAAVVKKSRGIGDPTEEG